MVLGALGALGTPSLVAETAAAAEDGPPVSTDSDRHRLATDTRSAEWLGRQLQRAFHVRQGQRWHQLDRQYRLPDNRETAADIARVLNALIDGPYEADELDCNDMTFQLVTLFGRAGLNAGVMLNDSHMWALIPAADGSLVEWEPQVCWDVSDSRADRYTTQAVRILL